MLIGTAVMVLPFQHPSRLAEDAAMVDALSGGRLLLGVGRGYQVPEFDVLDVPQDQSRAMFLESLEIIKKAFTEDNFSYQGQFWKVCNATVFPKPVQKPHPPIYWAGISPATYELAGRLGYPVLRGPNFTSVSAVE
jgi:alkanesulfonate monooxygenase SsuD/methylene tetrahydromethanopterin reductase-like flavin-dependent oxidoreductase (luciferase family)